MSKRLRKQILALLGAAAMLVTSFAGSQTALAAQEGETGGHTMWIVGDSTVSPFTDTYYYPRYGYGTQIGNYLDSSYTVQNLAESGRSSKSYLTDSSAKYAQLTAGIKEGDVLVIGFGHNDEKDDDATRFTDPNGDYKTEGSFAKSLYDNFVKVALDAGAEVILCTPIVRRNGSENTLTNANKHVTAKGDYAQAIRKLGADVNVTVVDLTKLTTELYESIGAEKTLYMHAWTSNKESSVDNTHLNIYGAKKIAYMLATEIAATDTKVAAHISLKEGEPSQESDLVSNPDYVEKPYDSNLEDSKLFEDYVIGNVHFKGTAFGDLGGSPSLDYHKLSTDENGNMNIKVLGNKGKVAATADGIVMYYYQVPVGSNFVLSAKATVNSLDLTNSQVAFGLMARDDMYIDKYDKAIASDYVVAGSLGKGSNCYYRKDGVLGGKGTFSKETLAVGASYTLRIASNSDGYACKFGEEDELTGGYDFQLTSIDSEYVYIGMFAVRNADITYSDIYLEVDGKVLVGEGAETEDPQEPSVEEYTGLLQDESGQFVYIENGVPVKDKYAYVEYDNARFLVANGVVASEVNGLAQDPEHLDDWYFVAKGQIQEQTAGIVGYDNEWFYVQGGKLDTTFSGYKDYDGGRFLVAVGRIAGEVDGLVQDPHNPNDWYYVAEGQVAPYTGLVLYDEHWFYVADGKFDVTYTGPVEYDGETFDVINGCLGY